jgi:hypothetical protein
MQKGMDMPEPGHNASETRTTLSYESPKAVDALVRPAGAALMIWGGIMLLACAAIAAGLVGLVIAQISGRLFLHEDVDLVMIFFALCVVLLLSWRLFSLTFSVLRIARGLLRGQILPLKSTIEGLSIFTAFLCIVGGISLVVLLGTKGWGEISIAAGLAAACFLLAGGLAYTKSLLVRLDVQSTPGG